MFMKTMQEWNGEAGRAKSFYYISDHFCRIPQQTGCCGDLKLEYK